MKKVKEIIPRGIFIREGKILLARKKGESHYFLIGGRMEDGETLFEALAREVKEELAKEVKILDYAGAIEHHFITSSLEQYEVCHYFTIEIPDLPFENDVSAEEEMEFLWTDNFEGMDLRPPPVKKLLNSLLKGEKTLFWDSTIR